MTVEVILNKIKYLSINNGRIQINFNKNSKTNVLRRIFLNSRKDRQKDVKTETHKDGVNYVLNEINISKYL